jgi:uncharacterized membrane protein YhaH (DUF805 family)
MKWYITALKKYAVFSGRARRREYWMFLIFNTIFATVATVLDSVLGTDIEELGYGIIYVLYALAVLLPGLAVTVRRLHDVGKSGWWIFINLVPVIGFFWFLGLLLTDSQPGINKYGPNPKAIGAV